MNEQLIGFNSFIYTPSGSVRDLWLTHRLVILPDYQGLGIGIKFNEFCCENMLSHGLKVYLKTAHFKLISYLKKSNLWKSQDIVCQKYNKSFEKFSNTLKNNENPFLTKKPFKVLIKNKTCDGHSGVWINRTTISSRYVGKNYNKIHKLIIFEAELSKQKTLEVLKNLTDNNLYYYEIYCDSNKSVNQTNTLVCHELGLCSYSLYSNNFKDVKKAIKIVDTKNIIYIYDSNHNLLLKDMNNVEKILVENDLRNDSPLFDFNIRELLIK